MNDDDKYTFTQGSARDCFRSKEVEFEVDGQTFEVTHEEMRELVAWAQSRGLGNNTLKQENENLKAEIRALVKSIKLATLALSPI